MTRPTIVLVHGAFADGSSWSGVIERLQAKGYAVEAPANPLRGVTFDAAYLSSVVEQIEGPVLLVGHSYGGAVISNVEAPNVVGLVFVAAFAPDGDEVLGDVTATSEDSILMPTLSQRTYPTDGETGVEFVVDPGRFRETFAADLPAERAAVLAATQRPVAASAFSDVCGRPAWSVPALLGGRRGRRQGGRGRPRPFDGGTRGRRHGRARGLAPGHGHRSRRRWPTTSRRRPRRPPEPR